MDHNDYYYYITIIRLFMLNYRMNELCMMMMMMMMMTAVAAMIITMTIFDICSTDDVYIPKVDNDLTSPRTLSPAHSAMRNPLIMKII